MTDPRWFDMRTDNELEADDYEENLLIMDSKYIRTALEYPALDGDVVTERHARYCVEHGHAVHTLDGVDIGSCPRCGDVT